MNQPPASPPNLNPAAPAAGVISIRLPSSSPRVTYTLLAVTIGVYLLQILSQFLLGFDLLIALGAKSGELIRDGELWRLFTPMFLHVGIVHLGFNMYFLYSFGVGLEQRFGHARFLLLYLLGGFAGNALSFLITPVPAVGSSTSVFGLVAAEGIFLYQHRRLFGAETKNAINNIVMTIVINLAIGFSSGGYIDNWGHIGGLLGGLIFTWFSGPLWEVEGIYPLLRLVDRRGESRDMIVGAAAVLFIFGALVLVAFFRPLG
ncbi:MAG: hypothetical protein HFACDABA_02558 [Anaerolineales bacterium]|nr:hypothetical protein [Anaerolineales bacterium]